MPVSFPTLRFSLKWIVWCIKVRREYQVAFMLNFPSVLGRTLECNCARRSGPGGERMLALAWNWEVLAFLWGGGYAEEACGSSKVVWCPCRVSNGKSEALFLTQKSQCSHETVLADKTWVNAWKEHNAMPNFAQICLKWHKTLFIFSLRSTEKEYVCLSKFWSYMGDQHGSDKVMQQPAPHHMHWHTWSANGRLWQRGRWPERTADSNNPPLSLFPTHTYLKLQHQCVAEKKRTQNIITIKVSRLFRVQREKERRWKRSKKRNEREKRDLMRGKKPYNNKSSDSKLAFSDNFGSILKSGHYSLSLVNFTAYSGQ